MHLLSPKKTLLSGLLLSFCLFTACGSDTGADAAEASDTASDTKVITNTATTPSGKASDLVLDLTSADFTPLSEDEIPQNPYEDLSVPTYFTQIDDTYFIVDCYHNQVIYHDNLTDPLNQWQVMTSDINMGHTIASDGLVYLIDDTENNRVLVFEKKDGIFYHTQTFEGIGNRPHYIVYREADNTFYVWSSMNGEMYLMRHNPEDTRMYLTEIRKVDGLEETYVRSFTIIGDEIYFVSGIPNNTILCADLESFTIKKAYPVPDELAGMIQLTKIQDYYYLTISTDITGSQDYATMIRTQDLENLETGGYEDVYSHFIGGGTPYYITALGDSYYLTEHRLPGHSIWRFQIKDNEICNEETIY